MSYPYGQIPQQQQQQNVIPNQNFQSPNMNQYQQQQQQQQQTPNLIQSPIPQQTSPTQLNQQTTNYPQQQQQHPKPINYQQQQTQQHLSPINYPQQTTNTIVNYATTNTNTNDITMLPNTDLLPLPIPLTNQQIIQPQQQQQVNQSPIIVQRSEYSQNLLSIEDKVIQLQNLNKEIFLMASQVPQSSESPLKCYEKKQRVIELIKEISGELISHNLYFLSPVFNNDNNETSNNNTPMITNTTPGVESESPSNSLPTNYKSTLTSETLQKQTANWDAICKDCDKLIKNADRARLIIKI